MKVTAYVYARISPAGLNLGKVEYTVFNMDGMGLYGWGKLVAQVEIDVPDLTRADLIPDAVRTLRDEQQRVRAEAEQKAQAIEAKIGNLVALENGGAPC